MLLLNRSNLILTANFRYTHDVIQLNLGFQLIFKDYSTVNLTFIAKCETNPELLGL